MGYCALLVLNIAHYRETKRPPADSERLTAAEQQPSSRDAMHLGGISLLLDVSHTPV